MCSPGHDTIAMYNCSFTISCGYTHLGFGVFWWLNGLGLVQLSFHVILGDVVTK